MRTKTNFLLGCLLLIGTWLFSACTPEMPAAATSEADPQAATQTLTETAFPVEVESEGDVPQISFDTGSLAAGFWVERVDAVAEGSSVPYWELLPEYSRATLDGYVISDHLMQPQIFVYPVEALEAANQGAAMVIGSMRTLLDAPQEIENMPLLPLFNAAQIMHIQVQYLDFQNGRGVRYLTFLSQGVIPVNNYELIYTFQGLTEDGKYYVAVILPVTHPSLPADGMLSGDAQVEFNADPTAYIANTAQVLNVQVSSTFTPDLTLLDAMIASLAVE